MKHLTLILLLFAMLAVPGATAIAENADRGTSASDDEQRPHRPMLEKWRAKRGERDRYRKEHSSAPLTDEEIQQLLPIVKDVMPQAAPRLEHLKQKDPDMYRQALSRLAPKLRHLASLKENDPQAYDREVAKAKDRVAAMQMVKEYKQAMRTGDTEKITELKTKARQHLAAHFDKRQERMERDLKRLEEKVKQMRSKLNERAANRDQLIDQYVERLFQGKSPEPRKPHGRDRMKDRDGEHDQRRKWRDRHDRDRKPKRDTPVEDKPSGE